MMAKRKFRYKIEYFDPADPKGMRWKVWKFKTLKKAREHQADLKVVWRSPAREFPIRKLRKVV